MPKRSKAGKRTSLAPPSPRRIWVPSGPESVPKTDPGRPDSTDGTDPPGTSFPNDVAASIHDFFGYLTTSAGSGGGGVTAARPGKGQWTVVAGFVALEDEDVAGDVTSTTPISRTADETRRDARPDQDDPIIPGDPVSVPPGQPYSTQGSRDRRKPLGRWRTMRICSLASGVKCLGGPVSAHKRPKDRPQTESSAATPSSAVPLPHDTTTARDIGSWSERDSQIIDMHAEILARRELECLLMREMRTLIQRHRRFRVTDSPSMDIEDDEPDEELEPFLLELVFPRPAANDDSCGPLQSLSARPWFRLKPSIQLVLYTSHAPCGAASDAAHLRRLDIEDSRMHVLLSRLGIHPPSSPPAADGSSASAFRESKSLEVPPVCKKPSRADAPPTTAFSCSDKLGRWQWLGFQGGRLARLFEPLVAVEGAVDRMSELREGPAPVRLGGLVVGEDYEQGSMCKIFGRLRVQGAEATYARLGQGLDEVLSGKADTHGRRWLRGLIDREPCTIWQSTVPFANGRSAATVDSTFMNEPALPPAFDVEHLQGMPLPLLRDILLPPPSSAPVPFPVAISYHANSTPQAIGPNGRLSGVTRDKKTKAWGANSVARVARGRMWDSFEALVGEYEQAFGSVNGQGRRKGGPGWVEASMWMEASGPYAGWHATLDA